MMKLSMAAACADMVPAIPSYQSYGLSNFWALCMFDYNPNMFPSSSTSSWRGEPGRPGMVTMFPAMG